MFPSREAALRFGQVLIVLAIVLIAVGVISSNFADTTIQKSCVTVTADITKAEIDAYVHALDEKRAEWSVLVEPDGEYTVIAKRRRCE